MTAKNFGPDNFRVSLTARDWAKLIVLVFTNAIGIAVGGYYIGDRLARLEVKVDQTIGEQLGNLEKRIIRLEDRVFPTSTP